MAGGEHERSRLRGDDLAAVAGVRDPEGAMDLDADVAVLAECGGAGVEADPDAHRRRPGVTRDPPLRFDRGLRGGLCLGEDGEELVAARVDLVAVGSRYRFAEQPPEVCEDGLPALPELAREPRRALDVGEEEGDGSGRERTHAPKCRSEASRNRIT